MKKKKIIIPVALFTFITILVLVNSDNANAGTAMCSYQAIYYYNEGIDTSHTGTGTTVNNTSWTDGSGTSANASNVSYEVRNMTASDCVNYANGHAYKSSASYGSGSSDCVYDEFDGSMTCGNMHLNNGSYETGKIDTGFNDFMEYLGGGSIEQGCSIFTDNTIKADNITINDNGINSETGKNQDEISRDYDYDSGTAMTNQNGNTFKYSAQTVIKSWTAPCEVEDEEIEKNEECSCSPGVSGGGSSMTTCGGTVVNSLSGSDCGSFTGVLSNPDNAVCQSGVTVNWSVSVSITEIITVSVSMNPSIVYAGGGVGIAVNHNSSSSSSINGICVSSKEKEPTCPSGYSYNSSRKICVGSKLVTNGCTDSNGEKYDCYREVTTGYTCTDVGGVNAVNQAKAEAQARSAAASMASGSRSPESITLKAKQSNDETDNIIYDLSSDVPYQGIALSGGKFPIDTETNGNIDIDLPSLDDRKCYETVNEESYCVVEESQCINFLGLFNYCYREKGEKRVAEKASDCESYESFSPGGSKQVEVSCSPYNYNMFGSGSTSMGISTGATSMINQACINIYTGKVRYTTGSCDSDNEIDGGHKYYIPLKYKDNTFNFNVYSGNISTLTTTTLNANCPVSVYQNFYDTDNGGYKFVYRPVDISEPITTVFPNRSAGSNWTTLYNTNNGSNGSYDLAMKRDKTEYSATLTPALIQSIKNINDANSENNMTYDSLYTINSSGKSTILADIGISIESGRYYNKLGECNRKHTVTSADGTVTDNSSSILEGTECW